MAAVRRIHIRRFADIVMGSWLNGAKTIVQKLAWKKAIDVSKGQSSFNETIRNNSPTIYLVDSNLIARVVIEEFSNKNSKFISGIYTKEGIVSADNTGYEGTHLNSSKILLNRKSELEDNIRKALEKEFNKTTIKELQEIVNTIYSGLISNLEAAEKSKKTYVSYQMAAARAGSELRRQLNNLGISILSDADSMIDNLNGRLAFVGYRFSGSVSNINIIIQKAVKDFISSIYSVSDKFAIGNLVHAGHVGIYSDSGLLGINMPGALISGLASNKFEEIEKAVGNLDIHIQQGIKLNTNYTAASGAYLDLQFNFAVSMTSKINSTILGPQEVSAIKGIVGNITDKMLETAIKNQITEASMLRMSSDISASPTITEFIIDSIVNTIRGKKTASVKHKASTQLNKDIKTNSPATSKKRNPIRIKVPNKIVVNIKDNFVLSVSNLEALLRARINEQVKQNMGTGNDKKVLNYRTGRLAESVSIERISESRAGMVSVFYNYMRNPYGTFSEGGRQQYPRTRDPKLLISKSIREVGAAMVGTRMRAVLV